MDTPLRVGIAGAGPWAQMVHAPVFAAGPETTLAAVWARRAEAAGELASRHGATASTDFDELLDRCDAVTFCLPPDVQPDLAVRAARAGKAVLLEKPLALDVAGAERIVAAVEEAGVGSLVAFTYRFTSAVRALLTAGGAVEAADVRVVSGGFLDGPFSHSSWRQEHGALYDLGPHALDLLESAVGPIVGIERRTTSSGTTVLTVDHADGAVSSAVLSGTTPTDGFTFALDLYGPSGARSLDVGGSVDGATFDALRAEFAHVARTGGPHPCDARRGLEVQRLLELAQR